MQRERVALRCWSPLIQKRLNLQTVIAEPGQPKNVAKHKHMQEVHRDGHRV